MPSFCISIDLSRCHAVELPAFDKPGLRTVPLVACDVLLYGDPSRFAARTPGACEPIDGVSQIQLNRATGQIEIISDPGAAYPLYVGQFRQRLWVASDLPALTAAFDRQDVRPDARALEQLLAFGQLLGTQTTAHDVILLSGGACMRVSAGSSWYVEPSTAVRRIQGLSVTDVTDKLAEAVVRQARSVGEALILPISGGLDTRLLLSACLAADIRPELAVFGSPQSADRRIGQEIADRFGLKCHAFDITANDAVKRAHLVAHASAGELPLQHGHALLSKGFAEFATDRAMMVGTGGEAFRAFYYDRGMPALSLLGSPAFKTHFSSRAKRWVKDHVLGNCEDVPACLRADLDRECERVINQQPDLARGLDQIYLQMRVRRAVIAGQQILNARMLRLHPLLDSELQSAFAGLPVRWRLSGSFHRFAICRLAPQLAEIAWDRTERPLRDGMTWRERWPGLADRMGLEGIYAKAGVPLGDYRQMLSTEGLSELIGDLEDQDLLSDASRQMLMQPSDARMGALRSFAQWSRSLNGNRHSQRVLA